jgi:hypothetical protein
MIFATALCVVLLSYSASFGDSLILKNDTDLENKTAINLPPPPHFKQNRNDLVLRTKKMMEEENVKAVEKMKTLTVTKSNVLKPKRKIKKIKNRGKNRIKSVKCL